MMLLLLGLLATTSQGQISVTCSSAMQACCDDFAATVNSNPNFKCYNQGTVAGKVDPATGANYAEYDACHRCIGFSIAIIRPLVVAGNQCRAPHFEAYCSAIVNTGAGSGAGPAPPTPVMTPVAVPTARPAGPVLVSGPMTSTGGNTMMNCNQYLVNTCCQWGTGDPTYSKFNPAQCKPCLAGELITMRTALQTGECTANDIAFYCDTMDWDDQMDVHVSGGMYTLPTQTHCNGLKAKNPVPVNLTGAGPPPSPTPNPVAATVCDTLKPQQCKADPACTYFAKQKVCWDASLPTPCAFSTKKKDCKKNKACVFAKKVCSDAPPPPTSCADFTNKKECKATGKKMGWTCFYAVDKASGTSACTDLDLPCDSVNYVGGGLSTKVAKKVCKKQQPGGVKKQCKFNVKLNRCVDPNAGSGGSTGGVTPACSSLASNKDCKKVACCVWSKKACMDDPSC